MTGPYLQSTLQKMISVIFWMKVREPEVVNKYNTLCCCVTDMVNIFLGKLTLTLT